MREKIRKIAGLFLLTSILVLLTGCGKLKLTPSLHEESELNQNKDIKFETEKRIYPTGVKEIQLNVTNNTKKDIAYGVDYSLEKKESNEWMEVQPNEEMYFIAIALNIEPGVTGIDTISFKFFPELPAGIYRIIRSINGELFAAEFRIQ